jgi:hypothetical protein
MIEVWYCETEEKFVDLMTELETDRKDAMWRHDAKPTKLGFVPEIPCWVILDGNELSEHDDLNETATEELNTKFLQRHWSFNARANHIKYHTTKP